MFNKITAAALSGKTPLLKWSGSIIICNNGNKGGVGKSSVMRLLAEKLVTLGKTVILIDLDFTSAVQGLLSKQPNKVGLATLINKESATLDQACNFHNGVRYIYGIEMPSWEILQTRPDMFRRLFQKILEHTGSDYILFDTGAGDFDHTRLFSLLSDIVITVTQPFNEPVNSAIKQQTRLYEAYAKAKTRISGPQHILISNESVPGKTLSLREVQQRFEEIISLRPANIQPWIIATERKTLLTSALPLPLIKEGLQEFFYHPGKKQPKELALFMSRLTEQVLSFSRTTNSNPLEKYTTLIEPELQRKR